MSGRMTNEGEVFHATRQLSPFSPPVRDRAILLGRWIGVLGSELIVNANDNGVIVGAYRINAREHGRVRALRGMAADSATGVSVGSDLSVDALLPWPQRIQRQLAVCTATGGKSQDRPTAAGLGDARNGLDDLCKAEEPYSSRSVPPPPEDLTFDLGGQIVGDKARLIVAWKNAAVSCEAMTVWRGRVRGPTLRSRWELFFVDENGDIKRLRGSESFEQVHGPGLN
jgi:hypothetical protein